MESRLVAFYSGHGADTRGRHLADILQWPDEELERVHDYIQWLFPTAEPSGFNPDAPLVTDDVAAAFRSDAGLRQTLVRSFDRLLSFYGLERVDEAGLPRVRRGHNWDERRRNWLTAGNHNHLRLTRIMKSLTTLGCAAEARALRDCLIDVYEGGGSRAIGRRTLEYWMRATP